MLEWIAGGSLLAVLCLQVIKELLGKIENRWGKTITLLVLLIVSFGIAGSGALMNLLPTEVLTMTGSIFAGAIAIYEVLYKALYRSAIKGDIK